MFCVKIAEIYEDNNSLYVAYVISGIFWYPSNLIFFLTRLCEPNIREFLKDKARYMAIRGKIWCYKLKDEEKRIVSNQGLLALEMFDQMKLEKIEQIFITVCICYFKSTCFLTPKSNEDKGKCRTKFLKENDLAILNDSLVSQKYNSFYVEYKKYADSTCDSVMNIENIDSSTIGNSFLIEENKSVLCSYIRKDTTSCNQFTLTTFNSQFQISTVNESDFKHLTQNMHTFYERYSSDSFLQRIYGIMKITLKGNIYRVVILDNPLNTLYRPTLYTQINNISGVLPVKNSYLFEMLELETSVNTRRSICEDDEVIRIHPEDLDSIKNVIAKDLNLLHQMKIVHYSLDVYTSTQLTKKNARKTYLDNQSRPRIVLYSISNILQREVIKKGWFTRCGVTSNEYRISMNKALTSVLRHN